MSSPDHTPRRLLAVAAAVATLATVSACTVRPLYSDATIETGAVAGPKTELRSIAIDEVNTRYGQSLRNHLIFLFNGGAGQPETPKYRMVLNALVNVTDEAVISVGNENRPTAALLQMIGSYVLTDTATGAQVASGSRTITASYDHPSQEFANMRARRDAEDRAARELAEFIRLDVAQRLAKG